MKLFKMFFVLALLMSCCLSGVSLAQGLDDQKRVIEEDLVLKDPTVAPAKKLSVGGSMEYWYVTQKYDTMGADASATGDLKGSMPGFSFFIGYGDFTLQTSYRKGSWDSNQHAGSPYNFDYAKNMKDEESEIALRCLFFKSRWFNPYLLIGYNDRDINVEQNVTTPGGMWSTGRTNINGKFSHKALLTGVGTIVPVNKIIGVRGDLRVMFDSYNAVDSITGREVDSAQGLWYRGTLTGYWNIINDINLQVGGRYDYFPAKVNNGIDRGKIGIFISLGYTYKF